jgi:predicted nucleotidyltransferase
VGHDPISAADSPALRRILARASRDSDVLAVLLYGSHARADASPRSDVDVCLVLAGAGSTARTAAEKRLEYLAGDGVDLQVFQLLPLVVRSRVLKEGEVLFVRDEGALYDVAMRTVKAYEAFRRVHRAYLDAVAGD